jgi:hypothetical protein
MPQKSHIPSSISYFWGILLYMISDTFLALALSQKCTMPSSNYTFALNGSNNISNQSWNRSEGTKYIELK